MRYCISKRTYSSLRKTTNRSSAWRRSAALFITANTSQTVKTLNVDLRRVEVVSLLAPSAHTPVRFQLYLQVCLIYTWQIEVIKIEWLIAVTGRYWVTTVKTESAVLRVKGHLTDWTLTSLISGRGVRHIYSFINQLINMRTPDVLLTHSLIYKLQPGVKSYISQHEKFRKLRIRWKK